MGALKKLTGANYEIHDTLAFAGSDGYFDPNTETVHLSLDATSYGGTVAHELTHWIEKRNKAGYAAIMTFCREQADARDSRGWQQLVNRKAAEYGELHAESEAVASMMEGVLSDEAMIREFCQKNQRAGQKILQFFGDLMDEIRKLFANDQNAMESRWVKDTQKQFELWEKALEGAANHIINREMRAEQQDVLLRNKRIQSINEDYILLTKSEVDTLPGKLYDEYESIMSKNIDRFRRIVSDARLGKLERSYQIGDYLLQFSDSGEYSIREYNIKGDNSYGQWLDTGTENAYGDYEESRIRASRDNRVYDGIGGRWKSREAFTGTGEIRSSTQPSEDYTTNSGDFEYDRLGEEAPGEGASGHRQSPCFKWSMGFVSVNKQSEKSANR